MAYLVDDDKQLQNGQAQNTDPNAPQQSISGGGSGIVEGGGVSQAGVGKGGTSGWTNIQSYLKANEGNQQGSANILNSKVGGEFSSEANRLGSESSAAKNLATQKVNDNTLDKNQALNQLNTLASGYNYKGPQSDPYNQGVAKVKNAYNYDYVKDGGPTDYAFGLNSKAQGYGSGLKSDSGFSGVMNSLYGEAAGGQLGKGQQALQTQLDVSNPYLAQARTGLNTQYDALNKNIGNTVADTSKYLGDQSTLAQTRKNQLQSQLGTQKTADYKSIDDAKSNWQAADNAKKAGNFTASDYASGGPRGVQNMDIQLPSGATANRAVNYDKYYTYANPNEATNANVGGVDTERNRWNVINEVMGLNDRINNDDDVKGGSAAFDQSKLNQKIAQWKAMEKTFGDDSENRFFL